MQIFLKVPKFINKQSSKINFKLWLEFELFDPNKWDIENEFFNIHVDLEDGRHYGLTIWTYKFLETTVLQDKETGENLNSLYQIPLIHL